MSGGSASAIASVKGDESVAAVISRSAPGSAPPPRQPAESPLRPAHASRQSRAMEITTPPVSPNQRSTARDTAVPRLIQQLENNLRLLIPFPRVIPKIPPQLQRNQAFQRFQRESGAQSPMDRFQRFHARRHPGYYTLTTASASPASRPLTPETPANCRPKNPTCAPAATAPGTHTVVSSPPAPSQTPGSHRSENPARRT